MKNLILFDFDRTLYDGDSMIDFIRFVHGKKLYWFLFLTVPKILLWKLGLVSSTVPKERLLTIAFKGVPAPRLEELAEQFGKGINEKLYARARVVFNKHINNQNDEVYIVSASCYLWLQPWCDQKGVGLIATGLTKANNSYTGKLSTLNCTRDNKVVRIQEKMDLSSYNEVIVYGKGRGDLEMLALATNPCADISY